MAATEMNLIVCTLLVVWGRSYESFSHKNLSYESLISQNFLNSGRLSFSSPLRCKLWQERITECLRRIIKEPKAAFAFIHRAYNKDEKMARQDQLRRSMEGDVVGVVDRDGPGEELEGERELIGRGNNPLLSLKGESSRQVHVNTIWHNVCACCH